MESRSRQVSLRELGAVVTMLAICFASVTQGTVDVTSPLLFVAIVAAQIASPLLILERIASRSNGWITIAIVGCYVALVCISLGFLLNDIPALNFDSLLRTRRGC